MYPCISASSNRERDSAKGGARRWSFLNIRKSWEKMHCLDVCMRGFRQRVPLCSQQIYTPVVPSSPTVLDRKSQREKEAFS